MSILYENIKSIIHYYASSYIFYPPPPINNTKYLPNVKNIKIISKNSNKIDVIVCYPHINYNNNKIIIYSHGNASNNCELQYYLTNLSNMLNIMVVCYDYQGYGNSEGYCSEQNCYDDITSVVEYVRYKYHDKKIYLIGQSLGTGIVIDYVSKHDWHYPIILISPYESMLNIAVEENSIIRWLLAEYDMFSSIGKISKVRCPVKIFHGAKDSLINISHARKLYEQLPNKTFEPSWIMDCGHNDITNYITVNDLQEIINY